MKVVIYTPSKSVKGNVVLEYLSSNEFFLNNFNTVVIIESINKEFINKFSSYFRIELHNAKNDLVLQDVDIVVTLGWGKIVSNDVISSAKCGAINCHSSLLPDYKGSSVYFHYWANFENFSGATIHYLTEKVDGGNIVSQTIFRVGFLDTPNSILRRASELTGPLLVEAIMKVSNGYMGEPNEGGRYFYKAKSKYQLICHRAYNCTIGALTGKKWFMPYKK